jgi:hypothetical protein
MRLRLIQSALILTAIAVFAAIIWITRREHKLATAFQNMQVGTMESEARIQLGVPWKAGACGQVFGGSTPPGCKEEYIYASPYAHIIPRYWAFRFDERGRLINKYEYQSP